MIFLVIACFLYFKPNPSVGVRGGDFRGATADGREHGAAHRNIVDHQPLYELYQDKKDDTELQIQILFTFLRVLSYQDTREELLYSTRCVSMPRSTQAAERKSACLIFYLLLLPEVHFCNNSLSLSIAPSRPSLEPPSLS